MIKLKNLISNRSENKGKPQKKCNASLATFAQYFFKRHHGLNSLEANEVGLRIFNMHYWIKLFFVRRCEVLFLTLCPLWTNVSTRTRDRQKAKRERQRYAVCVSWTWCCSGFFPAFCIILPYVWTSSLVCCRILPWGFMGWGAVRCNKIFRLILLLHLVLHEVVPAVGIDPAR